MRPITYLVICLILVVLTAISTGLGREEKVVGEQLCVDGNQNINLEGIMCEKTEATLFGMHRLFLPLFFIPLVLWIIIGRQDIRLE
jgi:hypothetical protein